MRPGCFDSVTGQYRSPDPLQVRIETHQRYQRRRIDLDLEVAERLSLPAGTSVLDAGCGTGSFLRYLRDRGHSGRLTGLDQSPGMIETARSEEHGIGGVVGNISSMPFADGEFDHAVARHMLYHVKDVGAALSELDRVSSRRLLLTTGSTSSMPYLMDLLADVVGAFGVVPHQPVMHRFSTENAGSWCDDAGLNVQESLLENELVFESVDPVVAYVLSCLPSYSIGPDSALYGEMGAWLGDRVAADLRARGGTIVDPTRVGVYVVLKE